MKLLLPVLILLILGTSCKKKLTKRNAAKQIIAAEHYPIVKEFEFIKQYSTDYNTEGRGLTVVLGEDEFVETQKILDSFATKGLITFETVPHREETTEWLMGTTVRTWNDIKIKLTAEGNKYFIKENEDKYTVKLCDTDFDVVKAIDTRREYRDGKNTEVASVGYTTSYINITPFGRIFGYSEKGETHQSVYFLRGQDGWKINKYQ